jgi:mono/diheme cytochrome c family protein
VKRRALRGLPAFVVLLLGLVLSACAGVDPSLTPAEQGKRLYVTYCEECHGVIGAGATDGPSLLDPAVVELDDEDYRLAVLEGVEASTNEWDGMSAIPALDDREIELVTAHVRTLQGSPPQESPPG